MICDKRFRRWSFESFLTDLWKNTQIINVISQLLQNELDPMMAHSILSELYFWFKEVARRRIGWLAEILHRGKKQWIFSRPLEQLSNDHFQNIITPCLEDQSPWMKIYRNRLDLILQFVGDVRWRSWWETRFRNCQAFSGTNYTYVHIYLLKKLPSLSYYDEWFCSSLSLR